MSKRIVFIVGGLAAILVIAVAVWISRPFEASRTPGDGTAAGQSLPYEAGPFRFAIDVSPSEPVVGWNTLKLTLHSQGGEPVGGASVAAQAQMPAMGTMPAMHAPADITEVSPGVYEGKFNLAMEGSWPLTLDIEKAQLGRATITFDMATGRSGLRLLGGAERISPSGPNGQNLPYKSGSLQIDAKIEPDRPRVGENDLQIVVQALNGDPVSVTNISAVAEMPAMGTMPAMQAPADLAQVSPDRFEGTLILPMEGSWPITIEIESDGDSKATLIFDMATGREGLRLLSGATERGGTDTATAAPPGTVTVDARRRQLIGLQTEQAVVTPLTQTIRAYGRVDYDERRLSDINLKYEAWVSDLKADFVGARVEAGDHLFSVFSPDLYAAQREYLDLLRGASHTGSGALKTAAEQRLRFWGMSSDQIAALRSAGRAMEYVPIVSPQNGTVILKNIVEGTGVPAGTTLMRIADLSQVWIEAELYEQDLALVSPGMSATVRLPFGSNRTLEGIVEFVYPYFDDARRTGRIRLSFDNPHGDLKPDMYAEVLLRVDLGERLTVDEDAVIVAGDKRIIFEDLGDGRLAPRLVSTGVRADGRIEIVGGLDPGSRVVTSGNFLIASESKLTSAVQQW